MLLVGALSTVHDGGATRPCTTRLSGTQLTRPPSGQRDDVGVDAGDEAVAEGEQVVEGEAERPVLDGRAVALAGGDDDVSVLVDPLDIQFRTASESGVL